MRYLSVVLVAFFWLCPELAAQAAQGGGAAGGQRDSLPPQELLPAKVVAEATSVFNAKSTTRYRGTARIESDSTVPGNVSVLGGQLTIAGHVRGSVVAINSDVILETDARVDQDILVVGGVIVRRENGRVRGEIRTYRPTMVFVEEADSIVPDPRYTDDGKWWSNLQFDSPHNRSKITVQGDTYNRVEGLPILIGPSMRHTGARLRTEFEALGIIRSADRFRWDSENLGHRLNLDTRMNREKGIGIGGSLYDVVVPVESWQFTDQEAGLSTFILHRDFRDYYGRHGGSLHTTFFRGYERELELSYANEKWISRAVRDTWTLFRDDKPWRPNPEVHEGQIHVLAATLRVDTRNSETVTRSGWFINGTVERGSGDLSEPGQPGTLAPVTYSRAMLDLRRYTRLSSQGQLNFRIVYGARLGDDELPMQKRFSVGGPGSLPGYDFRRLHGTTDVGMCTNGTLLPGEPGRCERMALFQAEYRGDIHLDLFGSSARDQGDWRDVGRHAGAQWTIFADAGRGWLISDGTSAEIDGLTYDSGTVLPRLGTFRTDVGAGLDLGFLAVFVAKSVSQTNVPANFFVRLQHRF